MNLPFSTSSGMGLAIAAIFGLVFGILLQKGRVTDYNVIVNLFRMRDWTVLRVMLTAILVGGVGVFIAMQAGWLQGYHIKDLNYGGIIIGGTLFGIGMVLYGYCPGTGVAAIATGSIHALIGFIGMLFGGIIFALTYPAIKSSVLSWSNAQKTRLPETVGGAEWLWWTGILIIAVIAFISLPKSTKTGD